MINAVVRRKWLAIIDFAKEEQFLARFAKELASGPSLKNALSAMDAADRLAQIATGRASGSLHDPRGAH